MNYCNGGNLGSHLKTLKKMDEEQAKFYISQIILAVEYLHKLDIVYRDIKPENFLIDSEGYLKLTDFGLS